MKHSYLIRFCFAWLLLFFIAVAPAFGQTAQVTGRVSDQAGAIVPDAQVVVTNTGTGISSESVTNSEGYYTVPLLRPGEHRIEVKKAGFKPIVQAGVTLQVEQVLRLDYTLETGAVTETVGISLVVSLWTDGQRRIPVGIKLWRKGGPTKVVLAARLLRWAKRLGLQPDLVVMDSW